MSELVFKGRVRHGKGKFSELGVPGRNELLDAPPDWPMEIYPGSLNVVIDSDGYPSQFSANGLTLRTASLHCELFSPAIEIPRSLIKNNKLRPSMGEPRGGDAQVWRARLFANTSTIACWVMRRFGSGINRQLELVSHEHLRSTYGIHDHQQVGVQINCTL